MERREGFWQQVGQVILGLCIMIGAGVLVGFAYLLFKELWPHIEKPSWFVVGHALGIGLMLFLFLLGVALVVSPGYAAYSQWKERHGRQNALASIGATLGVIVGIGSA